MPEGHTLHRIARDHSKFLLAQRLSVSSPQGRFRAGAKTLNGLAIESIEACGKHLFYHWESERILHVHLGLYGRFRLRKAPLPDPQGEIRLRVQGPSHGFDLHGPHRCELLTSNQKHDLTSRLGPDPLRKDADPEQAWTRISKSRGALGSLLLNQSVISGLGNIYRAEALFQLGIHPDRQGRSLSRCEFDDLWSILTKWLAIGVKYNRIITRDAAEIGKTPGKLTQDERLMVYKKDHCIRCESEIVNWECAGRTIYACPACQHE